MIPTADPTVLLEELREGYARYRNADGRRWEVHGVCDRRGHCLIGAVIDGETVQDIDHLNALCVRLGTDRPDSRLDVPVTPEFRDCCPFQFVELERA